MNTTPGCALAAPRPPSPEAGRKARLVCLSPPRIEAFGQTIDLGPRNASDPVQLLLRVVAAGAGGIPVARLTGAMWPGGSAREARHRLEDCQRCLALLLGVGEPPIRIREEVATIEGDLLEVDSLVLEKGLAPLLDPFRQATPAEAARARTLLGRALSVESVFLPGFDAAWADSARHRIADAVARAARQLSSLPQAGAAIARTDEQTNPGRTT